MLTVDRETKQREVENNFAAFQKVLHEIIKDHQGEFALMKGGKIIGFFSTFIDAEKAGQILDKNGLFSIQKVDDSIINLGIFSYA